MNIVNSQDVFSGRGFALTILAFLSLLLFAAFTSGDPMAAAGLASWLVVGAAALRWHAYLPKLGLYVFVGLVPLSAVGGRLPFPMVDSLTKAVFMASFGLLLFDSVVSKRRFVIGSQGLAGILFGGSALLSYLLNEKTGGAFIGLVRLVDLILLFLLVINVLQTGRDVAILFAVIVATCLLSAAGGLLMPIQWSPGYGTAGTRLAGWTIQADAPTFGMFLLLAVLICLYYLMTNWRSSRTYALFPATIVMISAIMLTLSRGAVLALLTTVGYMLLRLKKRISMAFVVFSLLTITLTVPLIPDALYARIDSMITRPGLDAPIQWRLDSARIGLAMVMRNPLVGCGPGNFTQQYLSPEFRFDRPFRPASIIGNLYISVIYDTGLIGLTCLALVVGLAWWNLRFVQRSYESGPTAVGPESEGTPWLKQAAEILEFLLVAYLMFSFFSPIEKSKYFWVILAASAVLARLRRGERAALPPAAPTASG